MHAETKEALAYASVRFDESDLGVLTDENGMFVLPGDVKAVTISYVGFNEFSATSQELLKAGIYLQPNENIIEQITVGKPNANEIMHIADSLSMENHFSLNTAQPGYYSEKLVSNNEFLKYSEASFDRHMYSKEGSRKTAVHVVKARSAVDSIQLANVNRIFNIKKEKIDFDVNSFIEIGQAVSFNKETAESDKKGRSMEVKFDTNLDFNGYQDYADREAFDITYTVYKGKTLIANGRYLIDTETYAFLAFEMNMNEEANLNKMIPFVARAFLTIMGYNFKIRQLDFKVYTKLIDNKFYMDKAVVLSGISIAKSQEWVHGRIIQEYAMGKPQKIVEGYAYAEFKDEESTYDFGPEFWDGRYHLNTSESKQKIIENIERNNLSFEGDIGSERYIKWKAKQERKGK